MNFIRHDDRNAFIIPFTIITQTPSNSLTYLHIVFYIFLTFGNSLIHLITFLRGFCNSKILVK